MASVAKRYSDESKAIAKKINDSYQYFKDNVDRYNDCRRAVYKSSLSQSDEQYFSSLQRPTIECNVLKPYLSRARGEFSKQQPSIEVSSVSGAAPDDSLNDILSGHIRAILDEANNTSQFQNAIYDDELSGGFSVAKIFTEYESISSLNQVIRVRRVFDPTLCFFDPLARMPHKGDGEYCGEHFPMRREDVEDKFGIDLSGVVFARSGDSFNWYYKSEGQDIAIVCHFYKKKYRNVKIVLTADGRTMNKDEYSDMVSNWSDITEPPAIVKERDSPRTTVCRYTLIGGEVKEYVETDFSYLPLVFVDGDSKVLVEGGASYQRTIPFIESAIQSQRMKNFEGSAFLNEILNATQSKTMMPIDAFPEKMQQAKAWLMPQVASVQLYNATDSKGNPIPQPTPVFNQPIDPAIYNSFMSADDTIRGVLSTFDVSEGVNNNDLSGKAIVEAGSQSNAVIMPYIMNNMAAMTQLGTIILDLIPKYYITSRTIPVVDSNGERGFIDINPSKNKPNAKPITKYDSSSLQCKVEASVNFEVQRQRDLDTIISLMQSCPAFSELMSAPGALSVMLKNISIKGIDKLDDIYEQSVEKAKTSPPPPNPQMQALQLKSQEIQTDQQYKMGQLQIQQQKLQMDAQNQDAQNQIKYLQIQINQQQLELQKYQTMLQAQLDSQDQTIQIQKAGVEQESKMADLEIAKMDMDHKHSMDVYDRINPSL